MAKKAGTTFEKRRRERAKIEKREEKQKKRLARKANKDNPSEDSNEIFLTPEDSLTHPSHSVTTPDEIQTPNSIPPKEE